jgi:DNA primase
MDRAGSVEDGVVEGRLTKPDFDGATEPINVPLTFTLKLEPGHPYLKERGLSPEIIAEFGLGYCSRGLMGGRICIPIHNERGELVAYAGRWPGEDVPDDQERYKLPAKFQKSRVLFNLHRLAVGEHVVLVEGYWSTFRLHALGLPVAALMGWSVSADQIALLHDRGVRFVTLLLDGDETGWRGRERVLPDLAEAFFVSAPLLPDGIKPDTLEERALRELVGCVTE